MGECLVHEMIFDRTVEEDVAASNNHGPYEVEPVSLVERVRRSEGRGIEEERRVVARQHGFSCECEPMRIETSKDQSLTSLAGVTCWWDLVRDDLAGCDQCGQASKSMRGMSWRREAKKGVEDCENPGGAVKRALRPGYPN